jgi:hypothetical protein
MSARESECQRCFSWLRDSPNAKGWKIAEKREVSPTQTDSAVLLVADIDECATNSIIAMPSRFNSPCGQIVSLRKIRVARSFIRQNPFGQIASLRKNYALAFWSALARGGGSCVTP